MDLQENTTAKQKAAGVIDQDLPWWFHLYHIAWIISFPAVWYLFGFAAMTVFITIAAAYFSIFS